MFYYDVETDDEMVLVKADSPIDAIELACQEMEWDVEDVSNVNRRVFIAADDEE
jgi:hypothetical protein